MAKYFNITGPITTELLVPGDNIIVRSIHLTNSDHRNSHTAIVDLYIEKETSGKFYLMRNVNIPPGVSLSHDFSINNSSGEYGLYLKLTPTTTVTLTGSIDVTGTNVNVPGSGTAFNSELSIGDEIVVSGETRIINAITSDTAATVSVSWGSDLANDTSPDINPVATVDVILN